MGQLDGKVAIVTGGARGQGRAHCIALAREGARIAAWDIAAPMDDVAYPMASPEDLDETLALVKDNGSDGITQVVDVRDSDAVDDAVEQVVREMGSADILVANAGVCAMGFLEEMTNGLWQSHIDTNLTGPFYCMRAVVPHMKERGWGRIVATSSNKGRSAAPTLAHYVASKWGLIGLTKTVALEVAGSGITANVVSPSTVRSPMVLNEFYYQRFRPELEHPGPDDMVERLTGMNPLGIPWVEPEEISRAVMYFVLDAGYTTGTVLEVNLGTSASRA